MKYLLPIRHPRLTPAIAQLLLALTLALACTPGALTAQQPENPARVVVKLISGNRKAITDESVALILTTPRKGQARFRILHAKKNGNFTWEVPSEFCDGSRFTWYLVRGMTKASQVSSFFERPMDWEWARFSRQLQKGGMASGGLFVIPKGAAVRAKGRILGPGPWDKATALPRLNAEVIDLSTYLGFCYDENTGRFWVQNTDFGQRRKRFKGLMIQLDLTCEPGRGPAMARKTVLLDAKVDNQIQLTPESTLAAKVRGWNPGSRFQIFATLRRDGEPKVLLRKAVPFTDPQGQGQPLRFRYLPPGRYSLEITTSEDADLLWSKKGIELKASQHLHLESAIDLAKSLRLISILAQDAKGRPIDSSIGGLVVKKSGIAVGGSQSVRAETAYRQQAPVTGGLFRVQSEGYAPRILWGVKKDTIATLYPPKEVLVKIKGMPEDAGFRKNLFVRAEPATGFPPWAWSALEIRRFTRGKRAALLRGQGPPRSTLTKTQYCMAPVDEEGRASLLLTHPGLWKFQLVYSSVFVSVPVPVGEHPPAKIEKARHAVLLRVDAADFEAPYKKFQKRDPRKGGKWRLMRLGR